MINIAKYVQLLDLRDELDALIEEIEASEGKSKKLDFLLRISKIVTEHPNIQASVLGTKLNEYILGYSPNKLYLNENFASQRAYLRLILDEIQRELLEQSQLLPTPSIEKKIDELLEKRFKRSRLFQLGLLLLASLIGFAVYGIFEIRGYKVDVKKTAKEAMERGQHSIDSAIDAATVDIKKIERTYQDALLSTAKASAEKYDQDLKKIAEEGVEKLRGKVGEYADEMKRDARPDIETAIKQRFEDFGELKAKFEMLKVQIERQESIIRQQESSLAATSRLLDEFKKSPDKAIVDKVGSMLSLSKFMIWVIVVFTAISFLLSLIGIILARRR